jgi:6-phosphogluconolactonase
MMPAFTVPILLAILAAIADESTPDSATGQVVWFGTSTRGDTQAEGIYVARFDPDRGRLGPLRLAVATANPTFLAQHPSLPVLYAVSELETTEGRPGGGVAAFAVDPDQETLREINRRSSGGPGPCHVAVDPTGSVVLAANYGGGSVICLPLASDGSLGEVTTGGFLQHQFDRAGTPGIVPGRQERAHAHSITPTPDSRFAVVCDLGLDSVFVHALDLADASLTPHRSIRLQAGAGPRHFAFDPSGRFGYVLNELDLTVTACRFDAASGTLDALQTIPTLPDDVVDRQAMTAAEVVVHPSGRFCYTSNRGHDSITAFARDPDSGRLEFLGTTPIGGRTPRNFVVSPDGRFLLAAGQQSNTVTVFAIDPDSGALGDTCQTVDVPTPMCIRFARP